MYTQKTIRKKLSKHLTESISNKNTLARGCHWYNVAKGKCQRIAKKHNVQIDVVAQVMAALSPYNRWPRNIVDCNNLFSALHIDEFSTSTFRGNKEKAWKISKGEAQLQPSSLKTYAFYRNLMLDPKHVTIDVWYLRALGLEGMKLTPKRYGIIQKETIRLAEKHSLTGYQVQATIWIKIRKIPTRGVQDS